MLSRCLIVFVQYPQPGRVKSRLAADFGDDFAAGLYKVFALDILERMQNGIWQLKIYFYPPGKITAIKKLYGNGYDYRPQLGADLGEKMRNAFADCFAAGFQSAVLIGSDCPDLPRALIEESFDLLKSGDNPVIGPAVDGGYYLIGFRDDNFLPAVFEGITWGTSLVLEETVRMLGIKNNLPQLISEWHDIDTGADLRGLLKRNKQTEFVHSRTMKFLQANKYFRQ